MPDVGGLLKGWALGAWDGPGDFALAVVDGEADTLTLGLAPLSELELHVRVDADGTVRFATDLKDLIDPDEKPDVAMLGKALGMAAFFDEQRGFYPGVFPIHPGTLVRFSANGQEVHRFWDPARSDCMRTDVRTAGNHLRDLLEAVVTERLNVATERPASLLSGGRDSGAVTAIASHILERRGERLDAWTAAAFPGAESARGHVLDEAPIAAETARRWTNIDHHVVRPRQIDLCGRLDDIHRAVAVPIVQPLAVGWCEALWDDCVANGNRLLLSGDFGNYALSAGGPVYLDDVRREEGAWPWVKNAFNSLAAAPKGARGLVSGLLRRHLREGKSGASPIDPFLRGDLFEARRAAFERRPDRPASYRQWLRSGLRVSIGSNDVVSIDRPLVMTDPTRDRRIVDFVNALPASALAGPSDRRRLFDAAFGDLLPPSVLRPPARGRQNVDWHYSFVPSQLCKGIRRYSASPLVRSLVDCDALLGALDHWPSRRTLGGPIYEKMVWGVLPAVSMASFLYTRTD